MARPALQSCVVRIAGFGFQVSGSGFRVWGLEVWGVLGLGLGFVFLSLGFWAPGFGVWSWGFGSEVWGLESGAWGLGSGAWGLGSGFWGLEFGVSAEADLVCLVCFFVLQLRILQNLHQLV